MDMFGFPQETAAESAATDLCYDAFEVTEIAVKMELANKALSLDPLCVQAWGILGHCYRQAETLDLSQALHCCNKAIQSAKPCIRDLDKLEWGCHEVRPYLRAMKTRIDVLADLGRTEELIALGEEMLRLCPADNLQVRYQLISHYFFRNSMRDVRRIVNIYDAREKENEYSTIELTYKMKSLVTDKQQGAVLC